MAVPPPGLVDLELKTPVNPSMLRISLPWSQVSWRQMNVGLIVVVARYCVSSEILLRRPRQFQLRIISLNFDICGLHGVTLVSGQL